MSGVLSPFSECSWVQQNDVSFISLQDEMRKNFEKLKHELCEKEVERDRVNAKVLELQKWLDQSQEGKTFLS